VVIFAFLTVASILFMVRSACWLWTRHAIASVAVRLRRATKGALFERFLRAGYEEMSRRARGTVVNDINGPAEAVVGALTQFGYLLTGVFNALLMGGLLLYLSWWATLFIGILAVGTVQAWRRFADRRSATCGGVLYGLRGEQNKLQVDAIDGLKVVKAHGLESHLVQRQDALLAAEWPPELRLVLYQYGPAVVNELVAVIIILGLGVVTFLVPSLGIRFSMLAAFLLAVRRIAPALALVNQSSVNLNRHRRELEVVDEVLRRIPQERQGGRPIERVEEIRMERVSFAYASRPDKEILHEVSVAMPRGTVTAIVGPTGAGKSTVAHLVLGLYEPRAGAVMANGETLQAYRLADWRSRLGYVSQDFFVFNTTVRDNITLGDERVSMTQIEWAARAAQLHEFISSLPERYDTVVGDRGLRLSGGQCQRLAIARAILRKPDVLIFDEATSALDNLTERAVYSAISMLHREAIILVIAHRLSTVKEADQILVLQDGRIVECGTHETLMRDGTFYARLYTEDDRRETEGTVEPVETESGHARAR
jgi:ABC-type multidrug transport system fused ATPase/permease subunit